VLRAGGQLGTEHFRWNRGLPFLPGRPPSAVLLEVLVPGREPVECTFTFEELEDSWDQLQRGDVRSKVRQIVERLTTL
jgi:hypothetical protein